MDRDDPQDALAAAETTYFPPPDAGAEAESGERPPETVARAADSTLHQTREASTAPTSDQSQIATMDLPPEAGQVAGSTTSPTLDWSAAKSARPAPSQAATPAAAARQIGDYEIVGELGRGGMGVVYQARHRQLGRVVALKMIRSGAHADADELDRFLVEAQAVARLQHPGIVQIFDIGQHDGLPYFSLEYVGGRSLLARVAKEPLEPREAAELVEQLALAMQYAHDQGILHRDLKPANVLLTPDGKPKITDFGLAKHIEGESASTQTGSIMGTPSYMSPEQASGNNRQLTPATDQYALGAVLYHLVTGRPPFLAAKAVETLLQVLHHEPVPPRQLAPKLPIDLETICLKALQKDPQRRYESCAELAADLRRYLNGEPIVARPVSLSERAWRWCRRNPRIAIPTAASILLFLIAFGISAGSAWALASLNADLEVQTKNAKTQERIATQKAKEATEAKGLAEKRTDVALRTITTFMEAINDSLATGRNSAEALRKQLAGATVEHLSKLEGVTSLSGATERATSLSYHRSMYQLYRDVGETQNAWDHMAKADAIARQRIKDQTASSASRINLALICLDMSEVRQVYNRDLNKAHGYASESASLLEDVVNKPKPPIGRYSEFEVAGLLANAYFEVGRIEMRKGNPTEALNYFEKSRSTRDNAMRSPDFAKLSPQQQRPYQLNYRQKSATTYMAIADMQFRQGNLAAAKEYYAKSLAMHRQLFQQSSYDPNVRMALADVSNQAGYVSMVSGNLDDAALLLSQALKLYTELVNMNRALVALQMRLALAHYRLGILKQMQNDNAAALHFEACLKIRTQLATKDAINKKRQQELVLALARSGRHAEASEKAHAVLTTVNEPDIELLLDLARAYAQCSAADKSAAGAEAFRLNAIYCLQEAVRLGHQDKVYLATEPDFAPLRERDDFRAIASLPASR